MATTFLCHLETDSLRRISVASLSVNTIYLLVSALLSFRTLRNVGYVALPHSGTTAPSPVVKAILTILLAMIVLTFNVALVYLVVKFIVQGGWLYYLFSWALGGAILWTVNLIMYYQELKKLGDMTMKVWFFWVLNGIVETIILQIWITGNPASSGCRNEIYDVLYSISLIRLIALALTIFTLIFVYPFTKVRVNSDDPETPTHINRNQSALGSFIGKFKRLLPFLWPSKNIWLQISLFGSFFMLVLGRIVNVIVPLQYKTVVDSLTGIEGRSPAFVWTQILVMVLLRLLQGNSGLLQTIQSFMWIPIGQFTTKRISVEMFKHLHSLSLRYHITRKTGEIIRVLDRGTSSIVSLLQSILFNIVPVLVDITVAVVYFIIQFDAYFGIIIGLTMIGYLLATIGITEWRTKFRREMIELDNRSNQIGVDSLLNFETVKYYCAEDFESKRYSAAITNFQAADFRSSASLSLLNMMQNVIINGGLLAGSLLCAYRVVEGNLTIGDFILFMTYVNQLYGPLNWFGTMYRIIQQNFIDMEKMLQLFEEEGDIKDAPFATELKFKGGAIEFDNVTFSYDPRHSALKNILFKIPAGKTAALVGPSGGGKSSILKLLFRFYDVTSGRVLIDGQDIRLLTQQSLRATIGVVPQDTVLFNETVGYNIRYARPTATDEEVYAAAQAAQIHERIMSFPDKYDTIVGERGLRLSGGEKQRVAIARTILKDPKIILLDEATSALDTNTERQIQLALNRLSKDRTTLVIAHRLSTIVNADLILVINDGTVIDQGTHEELMLKENGLYFDLWHKQLKEKET